MLLYFAFCGFLLLLFADIQIDRANPEVFGGMLVWGDCLTLCANFLFAVYSVKLDELAGQVGE